MALVAWLGIDSRNWKPITFNISGGQEADAFIELFWARPLDLDVRSSLDDEDDDSFSTP